MAVNPDKLNAFMGKAVGDIGAALSANMVLLGDKLGLYKAMAKAGPVTPTELAKATKTAERYVREWLGNQANNGSRPARVSGGISTTTGYLKARRDFSARITWATS
jgi:hypothetical protein